MRRVAVGVPFVVFALIVGTASPGLAAPVWSLLESSANPPNSTDTEGAF